MGWVTAERQRIPLTVFIGVTDVRRALGCSRALAYVHLRRAARREPGTKRALTADEVAKLLAELLVDRAARVAFIVATSACWRETELARRDDVGERQATVLLRGTKRKTRFRTVPIVSPAQRALLAYALQHAGGTGSALFQPWGNVRRDLADACVEAKIERCSPNDLRRTFASWQVEAGVPLYPIAQAMGHKDTRMLERVYGRQTPEQLAALMARAMGLPVNSDCSTVATLTLPLPGSRASDGLPGPDPSAGDQREASPKNDEAQTACAAGPLMFALGRVPGPGIEPGTRGFSVPCSTI